MNTYTPAQRVSLAVEYAATTKGAAITTTTQAAAAP